jgi:hypothetical protein
MFRTSWVAIAVLTLVQVFLVGPAANAASTSTYLPAAERIVAVGDLHGDFEATRRVLRLAGVIDEADHWAGGDLVFVQTGDVLDRGSGEQAILDLLERLADEAAAVGGAVYVLNGNHEVMNAALDLRYVTEGGFADFEDAVVFNEEDSTLSEYPVEQRARVVALRPGGPYARLLADHNAVLVIGSNVFVHGGLLPEHLDYGLERINEVIRAWLAGEGPNPEWIHRKGSPVWTRRYSDEPDADACETLAVVLSRLGASRMIVGHTVQENGITSYCDGRVWCIDVGMSAHYGGEPQALEIVGDSVRVLREEPIPAEVTR